MTAEEALAAVRRAAEAQTTARAELAAAMTAAYAARVTFEAIGEAAGVSRQRVHQIVKGGG